MFRKVAFTTLAAAIVALAQQPAAPAASQGAPKLQDRRLLKPPGPYRLTAGDVIEIKYLLTPELNDTVQLRPDGRLSLPMVGEVELGGKSIQEASQHLEQVYASHLKSPRIWIQVRQYAGQKVFVTGEVPRPGTQQLTGDMTVLSAIGEAGGIKHTGDSKKLVLIRRGEDGQPIVSKIALMVNGRPTPEATLLLRPYDVIMVPETKIARLGRWVDQHIRQLSPAMMSVGWSYLANVKNASQGVLDF